MRKKQELFWLLYLAIFFTLQKVLELEKYLRENMFKQKFQHEAPPAPSPGFFKGGKKMESLRGFEWVVWNSYFNCNNVHIWKINFKYFFVILSRKSKAESNLFGWERYVKGNTSAILRVMKNFFIKWWCELNKRYSKVLIDGMTLLTLRMPSCLPFPCHHWPRQSRWL